MLARFTYEAAARHVINSDSALKFPDIVIPLDVVRSDLIDYISFTYI